MRVSVSTLEPTPSAASARIGLTLRACAALCLLALATLQPSRLTAQGQTVLEGTLEIYYEDAPGVATLRHVLNTGTERVPLQFGQKVPPLEYGSRVRARGTWRNGTLMLDADAGGAVTALALAPESNLSANSLSLSSPFTFGVQSTLVILINFQDLATQPFSTAQAEAVTFGDVNNFYLETSYGQTSLSGKAVGWFTIPASSTSCSYNNWARLADDAAVAAGIDLTTYPRRVYAFPQTAACGFLGVGTIGGGSVATPARAWINGTFSRQVVTHEMG